MVSTAIDGLPVSKAWIVDGARKGSEEYQSGGAHKNNQAAYGYNDGLVSCGNEEVYGNDDLSGNAL
jgi:hypothetical protein